jgi:hypothetical protein
MKGAKAFQGRTGDGGISTQQPFFDFIGGLVGKGQHDHVLITDPFDRMQIADLGNQHRCFAAADMGIDQTGRTVILDGCFLIAV